MLHFDFGKHGRSLTQRGLAAADGLKKTARQAVSCAWLALAFLPPLNWAAFFWIGSRAKRPKWIFLGCLYFLLSIPLLAAAAALAILGLWAIAIPVYLLRVLAWGLSITQAFGARKEYVARCEALAENREEAERELREKARRQVQGPPPPVPTAQELYRGKALNPEGVCAYLKQLQHRYPAVRAELESCLRQAAAVRARQQSLAELIELNGAGYLVDAAAPLAEAEQLILQNLMWVVNRGIVLRDESGPEAEAEFAALIQKVLAANGEVLEKCRALVAGASDLISGKGSTGSTAAIEAWTVAIRQQVRTSTLETTEG